MTILYAAIGRETDGRLVAESQSSGAAGSDDDHLLAGGNYSEVTSSLLEKLGANPGALPSGNRKTFVHVADVESAGGGAEEDGGMFDLGSWIGCGGAGDAMGGGSPYWAMGGGEESPSPAATAGSGKLDHYFHVLRGEGAYYAALSDDAPGRQHSVNFAFLDALQKEFGHKHSPHKIKKAKRGAYTKGFGKTLRNLVHKYNVERTEVAADAKVHGVTTQVEQLKQVMGENIQLALRRSKNLDALIIESDQLEHDANVFKKRSRSLKKDVGRKNTKMKIYMGAGAVLLLVIFSMMACGLTYGRCRASS